ncbi:hypothetical protein QF004_000920 [Chryseobacterium sp. MDT2-18]|nr:hypothetical protein [Chryseobacterium sp. MDT2-18]
MKHERPLRFLIKDKTMIRKIKRTSLKSKSISTMYKFLIGNGTPSPDGSGIPRICGSSEGIQRTAGNSSQKHYCSSFFFLKSFTMKSQPKNNPRIKAATHQ